ncbi:hypothetical protein [Pedobacter caeni]|uniref:Uncharacterized protein n=1 Tax=Pedobacter caeni TaxID=288992 RepID=A0A1M4WEN4_9SPHI|nr:hypothetical protein [Pedobacter caeni]SHE79674.1 hypothetical protein SAMN04488522_1011243 [Pedobacter caeni]
MYHIKITDLKPSENCSRIGGLAHIDMEAYPICPVNQKPMLLLMSLKKDIFDSGYAVNHLLEDENYCISVFLSGNSGPDANIPFMYTVNKPAEAEKLKNGTVRVILHKDTGIGVAQEDSPIPLPAQRIILSKFSEEEEKNDNPGSRKWDKGSRLALSKFGAQVPYWVQEPINIDPEIMKNFVPVFKGFFGPEFTLQIENQLISEVSKTHEGLLGSNGMGYLYLPTSVRNFIKKYQGPVEIGNFFIQSSGISS